MKKLILVVGILTQSLFGISQKFEIIKSEPHPILSGNGIGSDIRFGVTALTHDNDYIYGLSVNPGNYIIMYNPKTLEVIRALVSDIPKGTYEEKRGHKYPNGITYDGKYLWVAHSAKQKIYKLNKYTGKILDSIPGPPCPTLTQRYDGIEFDGECFWLIRNNGKFNIDLFKLSKSGKILNKQKINSGRYSLGLHYDNEYLFNCFHDFDKKSLTLNKYSISNNLFVESYPISSDIGTLNGITTFGKYIYFTTGSASTRQIYKLKLIKE